MGCGCVKTTAWWFCNACKKAIIQVRYKQAQKVLTDHRTSCPKAMYRKKYIHNK